MSNDTLEEEGIMKTPAGTLRTMACLLFVLCISAALAACGSGGGGGATSSLSTGSLAGPVTVDVSIATADVTGAAASPVSVGGSATVPSADAGYLWPEQIADHPRITSVTMDVVKVSLMPSQEMFEGEDMNGEILNGNSPNPTWPPDKPGFVTIYPKTQTQIDLLALGRGKQLASFFNKFDHLPAGTYDKIRVYYDNVTVMTDGGKVSFHPTAHSKFDIHFRQGHELVIPVTSDTTQPDGWVTFLRVKLDVVGLKLMVIGQGKSWKGAKVILRPQIFAEFVPPVCYSVAGTAGSVDKIILPDSVSGEFNVVFGQGSTTVPAAFDNNTRWAYDNNVLAGSGWKILDVPNQRAAEAFKNGAEVEVIGRFDGSGRILGSRITFTFPHWRLGKADNVWLLPDDTFIVRSTDNVTVSPKPARVSAYYDNLLAPGSWNAAFPPLYDTNLDNNVWALVRGYFDDPDPFKLSTHWISIGGPYPGP